MADFGSVTFSGEDMEYVFENTLNLRQDYLRTDSDQLIGISLTDPFMGESNRDFSVNHGSGETSILMYAGEGNYPYGDVTFAWYLGIVSVTLTYSSDGSPVNPMYKDYISNLHLMAYPGLQYASNANTTYTINVYYGSINGSIVRINNSLTQHITFTVRNPLWQRNEFRLRFYPNQGTPSTDKYRVIDYIDTRTSYITNPYALNVTFGTEGYTREGYQLIGWDTNAAATTPTYLINTTYNFPAGTIAVSGNPPGFLYAIWQKVASYVRLNNTWVDLNKIYAKVNNTFKEVDKVYVALNGQWVQLI